MPGASHGRENARVPRLLVVHHTPSPALQAVLEAVKEGAALVDDVELVLRPALSAGAADLLAADGVLLGTPANIGYMSGALKHFFDTVYYPCLDATPGLPYGVYVHGNDDRKSTRLNSSHANISYAVFCLKKQKHDGRTAG